MIIPWLLIPRLLTSPGHQQPQHRLYDTRRISNICAMSVLRYERQCQHIQTSNTSRTLVGNVIVDHSAVVGAAPSFNWLSKDNYKVRQEAFNFWDLVRLILEVLWYIKFPEIIQHDKDCCLTGSMPEWHWSMKGKIVQRCKAECSPQFRGRFLCLCPEHIYGLMWMRADVLLRR